MYTARSTTRCILPSRLIRRGIYPLAHTSFTRKPVLSATRARQYTLFDIFTGNTAKPSNGWSDRNPETGRKWTEAELKSMTQGHLFWGIDTWIDRERRYNIPPTKGEVRIRRLRNVLAVSLWTVGVFYLFKHFFGEENNVFDAPKFTPFSIVDREDVSPTSFIVTLRPRKFANNPKAAKFNPYAQQWQNGTWSVEFKQPELQITRSYTPLPPRKGDPIGDLRFHIREEKNGEMSRYLARLSVGTEVELRGPHTELDLPKEVTDVMFLAGGTGIAPALQVAHTLLQARKPTPDVHSSMDDEKAGTGLPSIHILWANRRREDCVGGDCKSESQGAERKDGAIVKELRVLQQKYPHNLRVDYLVDEEGSFLDARMISSFMKRASKVKAHALSSRIDSKLLFVSGPPGFVDFVAGPKGFRKGKEVQGDVGGLLGKVGIREWQVWKQ